MRSALAMPPPAVSFNGISNVENLYLTNPPSMNGDVSSTQYVQAVNLSFAVYSKAGTRLYGPVPTNTLFSGFGGPCQTRNDGGPLVQYDQLARRWLITQFAVPGGSAGYWQCIAVSTTSDARGSYYRYAFQISADIRNDSPRFGIWPDGYYASFNSWLNSNLVGATVVAFERDKMLAGQPAQMLKFELGASFYGLLPSDLDAMTLPPPAAPNVFVQMDDDALGYAQDQLEAWSFHADWSTPANSTFTLEGALPTVPFSSNVGGIPQPGTTNILRSNADRLMYRLAYRNFGSYEVMAVNHTIRGPCEGSSCRAAVRWYQLRRTGGSWFIYEQGTHAAPENRHFWNASVAIDNAGNMAVGMSAGSGTLRPSILYAGRRPGDPSGWLMMESMLYAGGGSQLSAWSQWGEYSSMVVDASDGCTFWYTNEYYPSDSWDSWRTRIAAFKFSTCKPGSPPVISGFTPSSGAVGSSVTISGSGFSGATAVRFGGVSGPFLVNSQTTITAQVPSGAVSGPISVTTPLGVATSAASFTVTGGGGGGPQITSFSPASGPVGTIVTVNGTGFSGVSAVRFNGVTAQFFVNSQTRITARVPTSATTGPISVKALAGTATSSASFTVTGAGGGGEPTITSFTPTSGPIGTIVTINGTGFSGATSVKFAGASAQFYVNSQTRITARVWAGAMTGPITVTTPLGTGTSTTDFIVF